jgi:ubiquinone/menaquinone biosynthesis C-methylase UbiE
MKPALSFRQPYFPSTWCAMPNGDYVLAQLNEQLKPWCAKFFGYHLVKLGALSAALDTSSCSIKQQVRVTQQAELTDVIADIDDLPFLQHSVDVCLLSHTFEFSLDPHHVVREANRILIPNGYLVITGFNPFSLAGLNKLIPYRRNKSPWNERFFTPMRVKDWLQLMGYEILADQRCVYSMLATPLTSSYITQKCRQFGQKYLTSFGSVYFIVAKKRVLPLTPIKPKWQLRPQFVSVKVSTRGSS